MAKTKFTSVDEYIAAQPKAAQVALKRVRSAIRKGVPGAEEAIWYQIPTYRLHGRYVIYFAGWKAHYSIYPSTRSSWRRSRRRSSRTRSTTRGRSASRSPSRFP